MDVQRLRHLLAVAEHGSIGRAAVQLGISQPALSKSLRRLEESVHVKLLERGPKGIAPTAFGKSLIAHARIIFAEVRQAAEELDALRGAAKGHVAVGTGPSIIVDVLPAVIRRFARQRPGVRVSVTEGLMDELLGAVARAEIDVAVVSVTPPVDEAIFVRLPVHEDTLAVVARHDHPLARRGHCRPRDLMDFPWVLPGWGEPVRQRFDEAFATNGLAAPAAQVETNSALCMKAMVLAGDFLSWMPRRLLRAEIRAGQVRTIAVEGLAWSRQLSILHRRKGTMSPACQAFVAELRGAFAALGAPEGRRARAART